VAAAPRRSSRNRAASPQAAEAIAIEALVAADDRVAPESLERAAAGGLAHRAKTIAVAQEIDRSGRHRVDVAASENESRHAVVDEFGNAADARRDDRDAARERLERRKPERFALARQQEEGSLGEDLGGDLHGSPEIDVGGDAEVAREVERRRALGTVADEDE